MRCVLDGHTLLFFVGSELVYSLSVGDYVRLLVKDRPTRPRRQPLSRGKGRRSLPHPDPPGIEP